MHVVFVSSVVGKQIAVEEGGRLVGIHSSTVQIVDVEPEAQPLVGIDGEVGFESFFSIAAVQTLIISQVGEWRQGIGKDDILRTEYAEIIRVGKDKLTLFASVEEDAVDAWRT